MKKYLLLLFLFTLNIGVAQLSQNLNELYHYDNDTIPTHFFGTFNEVWGYVDANDREYAIFGSAAFIHFFDVTDPANVVEITRFAGGEETTWRDFKVYQDRVYACSDNADEGLIIFDVSQLPNTVTKTYQNTEFFDDAHNIYIDEANGRLYAAGTNVQSNGLVVLDLTVDLDAPQLIGNSPLLAGLFGGYVHDLYVRDNIAYCSHGDTDSFVIWDFTDGANPQYMASFESQGYNHSNWVSEDGNTVVFAEEVPTGLPMGILDISDMANDNLSLYTYFKFPLLAPMHEGATPHNPYILGDLVYTSYYEDGLQVFDISDPNNPTTVAYFDTYPENTMYNGYAGCWGVYPFLPSGNILVSDMEHGLFILDLELPVAVEDIASLESIDVFPNPTFDLLNIQIETNENQEVLFELRSITGQLLKSLKKDVNGFDNLSFDLSSMPTGVYILNTILESGQITEKVIKQ